MRSLKQIQASRANGARSRGPITAQGKRNSSRNSIRHGFSAPDRSLNQNPPAAFIQLRDNFTADLQPRDPIEAYLVHTMAVAHWRKLQVIQAQTDFMNTAIARLGQNSHRAMRATRVLETSSEHLALLRYEVGFHLHFTRAYRRLLYLQSREPASNRPAERTQQNVESKAAVAEALHSNPTPFCDHSRPAHHHRRDARSYSRLNYRRAQAAKAKASLPWDSTAALRNSANTS